MHAFNTQPMEYLCHVSYLCRNEAIVPLFKVIEGDPNIGRMVVDYSISQTTLEEVFLNVSYSLCTMDTLCTVQTLKI